MTDQEKVRRCAQLMGIDVVEQQGQWRYPNTQFEDSLYDPLHDKAQALDLVIKLNMTIDPPDWQSPKGWNDWQVTHYAGGKLSSEKNADLLRAIVECSAKVGG